MTRRSGGAARSLELRLAPWLDAGFALVVLACGFVQTLRRIADTDHWHHLRAGEHLFAHGEILETFRYTALHAEQAYINHEWLYQAIVYQVDRLAGEVGLVALQQALVLGALGIAWRVARELKADHAAIAIVFVVGILAGQHRYALRPQHFSYLFLALTVLSLQRHQRGSQRSLWLLPPLMVVWVNLHAECIWALLVPGAFLAMEFVARPWRDPALWTRFNRLALAWLATLLAAMVNPHGWYTLIWPFMIMGEMGAGVEELVPPIADRFWIFWAYFGLSLVVLPSWLGPPRRAVDGTRKVLQEPWRWILVFAGIGYVAWTANRGIPHYVVVTAPFVAVGLSRMLARLPRNPLAAIGARGLVLGGLAFLAFAPLTSPRYFNKFDNVPYPEGAVDFLREHGVRGNVLTLHRWGGYVLWHGRPDLHPLMDGRYYAKGDFELYHTLMAGRGVAQLQELDLAVAVLAYEFQGPTDIADVLLQHTHWALVYWDDVSLVFVRTDAQDPTFVANNKLVGFFPKTQLLWTFDGVPRNLVSQHEAQAVAVASRAPNAYSAQVYLANARFALGAYADAAVAYERAIELIPEPKAFLHYQAALCYERLGQSARAVPHLERCLALVPDFEPAQAALARYRSGE